MTALRNPPSIVLGVTARQSLGLVAPLAEGLATRGWDVAVISDGQGEGSAKTVPGVAYVSLPMKRVPSPLDDMVGLLGWIRVLSSRRPDVVMVGTPKASLLGLLAARLVGVPTRIYHQRGLRLETVPPGLMRSLLVFLERVTATCATSVLAVSRSLAERLGELRLLARRPVEVVGSGSSKGVDLSRFEGVSSERVEELRARLGASRGLPVVASIGRLASDKGLDDLLAASDTVASAGTRHQLVIAGKAEDEALVGRLAAANRADRPVILAGRVDDIPAFLGMVDVHCLPTRREGFPNVVLEASAAAVPTITTDATGAVDSVVDGETGFVVPVGDVESLAEALGALLTDRQLSAGMGSAARRRAGAAFEQADVIAGICDYIEGAVAQTAPNGRKP